MDPETWITLSQNQDQMFSAIDKFLVRDDRPKVRQGVSRSIVGTLKRHMRYVSCTSSLVLRVLIDLEMILFHVRDLQSISGRFWIHY